MSNAPLVTVIIPCYNGEAFIGGAIGSVLAQSLSDWELIVIDDGSSDNSKEIVKRFTKDKRIRLLENERNLGIAKTKNRGVADSNGKFIAFLDQDDIWEEDKLRLQVARLTADSELAVVCTGMFFTDPALKKISTFTGYDDTDQKAAIKELYITPINSSSLMMIKKDSLESSAPFDETLKGWDDYELLMRLAAKHRIAYIREPLVKKRLHKGGAQKLPEVAREEEKVFEHILNLHPFLGSYKKERDAALFLGRSIDLLNNGESREAKHLALKRLKLCPLSPSSWILYLITMLPASLATAITKLILKITRKTKLFLN